MTTIEWLSRLIAFDTTSRNSNLELINAAQTWFEDHQVSCRLTQDSDEAKANLFATLPAADGQITGGIIFSGHTDVVPVDGQHWDTDPFVATLMNKKIYGRGACDMKGFLAVLLALLPELKRMQLSFPLHFAFSYDEEVGCRGAPLMIKDIQQMQIKPKACIVGEPTEMRPVLAHKGIQVLKCNLSGHAAHSSLTTQGCNAIEHAANLIAFIRDMGKQFKQDGPFDNLYDVPFTTISTNMIKGGNAQNTIPAECEFHFEFRHLPEIQPEMIFDKIKTYTKQLLRAMQQEKINANVEFEKIATVPAFSAAMDAEITRLAQKICAENETRKVAYATEAGLFQQAHIPTIVCGPGNIEQAHRANEYVLVDQLDKCANFIRSVVSSTL